MYVAEYIRLGALRLMFHIHGVDHKIEIQLRTKANAVTDKKE